MIETHWLKNVVIFIQTIFSFVLSRKNKNEVMITFLIDVLQLPNFGHMITSVLKFESSDKFLFMTLYTKIDVITFIFKYLYFKKT